MSLDAFYKDNDHTVDVIKIERKIYSKLCVRFGVASRLNIKSGSAPTIKVGSGSATAHRNVVITLLIAISKHRRGIFSQFWTVLYWSRSTIQCWASYFHKVTELLYFCYWWKKLATFNPLPIFPVNGSVTVTSFWYFKCNESVTSYYKCN